MMTNFSYCHNVFKSRLLQMRQNVGKGYRLLWQIRKIIPIFHGGVLVRPLIYTRDFIVI